MQSFRKLCKVFGKEINIFKEINNSYNINKKIKKWIIYKKKEDTIFEPWKTFKLITNEPWHDKTNKWHMRRAKTQISLGIRPIWSESWLSSWRNLGSLATY